MSTNPSDTSFSDEITPGTVEDADRPRLPLWTSGTLVFDEFRVKRPLGSGQTGEVNLVESLITSRLFAAKHFSAEVCGTDATSRRRFLRELKTWITLPEHEHIVSCRFFRTSDDHVAIFSDYQDGGNLRQLIEGRGGLTWRETIDMAIQLGRGLTAVHAQGLVHGDLKPQNILSSENTYKISDFGISVQMGGAPRSVPRIPEGTSRYMSPEQAQKEACRPASDVWSLAAVIMFAGLGEGPWKAGVNADSTLLGLAHTRDGAERCPRQLQDILSRCLERDPAVRPSSSEFVVLLERAYSEIAGEPYPRHSQATASLSRGGIDGISLPLSWFARAEVPLMLGADVWLVKARVAMNNAQSGDGNMEDALAAFSHAQLEAQPAASHLESYEAAVRLFEKVLTYPTEERQRRRAELAGLYAELAAAHSAAGDFTTAATKCRSGLLHCDELPAELAEPLRRHLTIVLNEVLMRSASHGEVGEGEPSSEATRGQSMTELLTVRQQAMISIRRGQPRDAIALYEQVIEALSSREEVSPYAAFELANTHDEYSQLLRMLGDHRLSLVHVESAISLWDALDSADEPIIQLNSGQGYRNLAIIRGELGDIDGAIAAYDEAIRRITRAVEATRSDRHEDELASCYNSKAITLSQHGRSAEALPCCDRCIAIRERLVLVLGRNDLADRLARAYGNKAASLDNSNPSESLHLHRRACSLLLQLVLLHGRDDLRSELMLHLHWMGRHFSEHGMDELAAEFLGPAALFMESMALDPDQPEPARMQALRSYIELLLQIGNLELPEFEVEQRAAMVELALRICRDPGVAKPGSFVDLEVAAVTALAVHAAQRGAYEQAGELCEQGLVAAQRLDEGTNALYCKARLWGLSAVVKRYVDDAEWFADVERCLDLAGTAVDVDSTELWKHFAQTLMFGVSNLRESSPERALQSLERHQLIVDGLIVGKRILVLLGEYIFLKRAYVGMLWGAGRHEAACREVSTLQAFVHRVAAETGSAQIAAASDKLAMEFASLDCLPEE